MRGVCMWCVWKETRIKCGVSCEKRRSPLNSITAGGRCLRVSNHANSEGIVYKSSNVKSFGVCGVLVALWAR